MFNVKNSSEVYHVYNLEIGKYVRSHISKEELIKYLAGYQRLKGEYSVWDYDNRYKNDVLDNINMSQKDLKYEIRLEDPIRRGYTLRKYLVIDCDMRVVDVRDYQEDILRVAYEIRNTAWVWRRNKDYKGVEFRKDPVPRTGKMRKYCSYTELKTANEIRKNSDKEIYGYIRPSRRPNNLPSMYDDRVRNTGKSWKRSKKKRQWM